MHKLRRVCLHQTKMAISEGVFAAMSYISDHFSSILMLVLVGLVTWFVFSKINQSRRLPPGPTFIPLIGCIPGLVGNKLDGKEFAETAKKYGSSVTSMRLLGKLAVIVNDFDLFKEIFSKRDFQDRPHTFKSFQGMDDNDTKPGLINSSGRLWKEQRRFTLHMMRDFGMGKISGEDNVCHETEKAISAFKEFNGRPFDPHDVINMAVSNIINSIIFGKRFNYNDVKFTNSLMGLNEFMHIFSKPVGLFLGTKIGQFILRAKFAELLKYYQLYSEFVKDEIAEHRKNYNGNDNDLIDAYMAEMETTNDKDIFNENQLQVLIQDLFMAGSETSYTTLRWAVLYMAAYPDVQEKVYQELIQAIGPNRQPTMSDKKHTPYTEAVLSEIQRFNTLVELVPSHTNLTEDLQIKGFTVPKKSMVSANLYAFHHDPKVWKKPNEFDPQNFLNENGKVINLDRLVQFSHGRRSCAGEALARMELYIFFASWMKTFQIKLETDTTVPDIDSLGYFIIRPKPFLVRMIPRDLSRDTCAAQIIPLQLRKDIAATSKA